MAWVVDEERHRREAAAFRTLVALAAAAARARAAARPAPPPPPAPPRPPAASGGAAAAVARWLGLGRRAAAARVSCADDSDPRGAAERRRGVRSAGSGAAEGIGDLMEEHLRAVFREARPS